MPKPLSPRHTKALWIAGLLCSILAVLVYCWSNNEPKKSNEHPQALQELIDKHLERAETRTQALADQGYPAIEVIFSKAFDNVPEFSKSILGWKSKWKLVLDKLPGNDKDRHEHYLKEQFERTIFTPDQLEAAVKQAVRERLMQIRDIENEMLIGIRADIEGLPELAHLESMNAQTLESRFEFALSQASEVVSDDLSSNIESQLVSLVAGEVMAQVAIRLGISAGILSTGASSGWATFGVGLVAGVLIDQIVTRIWDWWSEPESELNFHIAKQLALVHNLICKGDSLTMGLDGRFEQWNTERKQIRRNAIQKVFFPSEMQNAGSKPQT